jgi:hypothetical protein
VPCNSKASATRSIANQCRGPPEDIGGTPGYAEFLEAIADPNHEQHAELSEWSGGNFDPAHLSMDDINQALAELAKQKKPRSKTSSSASKNTCQLKRWRSSPDAYDQCSATIICALERDEFRLKRILHL